MAATAQLRRQVDSFPQSAHPPGSPRLTARNHGAPDCLTVHKQPHENRSYASSNSEHQLPSHHLALIPDPGDSPLPVFFRRPANSLHSRVSPPSSGTRSSPRTSRSVASSSRLSARRAPVSAQWSSAFSCSSSLVPVGYRIPWGWSGLASLGLGGVYAGDCCVCFLPNQCLPSNLVLGLPRVSQLCSRSSAPPPAPSKSPMIRVATTEQPVDDRGCRVSGVSGWSRAVPVVWGRDPGLADDTSSLLAAPLWQMDGQGGQQILRGRPASAGRMGGRQILLGLLF